MREFLEAIHPAGNGKFAELRMIRAGEVRQTFVPLEERDALIEAAMNADAKGWDVYVGALPRIRASGRAEDCVPNVGVLYADIDNKSVGGTHLAALMRIGAINLTPSIIVDSGNGIHGWWLLNQPYPFSQVQPAMKGLQAAIGSDSVHDAPRVLRLPATHNHKDCGHNRWPEESTDCTSKPVRLLHFEPWRRYRLSDFDDFIPREVVSHAPIYSHDATPGWEPSGAGAPPFPEGTRNASLARLAGIMVARGLKPIDMLAALLDENNRRCVPPLEPVEVERIVRSVSRYA